MLVNNLRFVTICSSGLERCMQPNVHDKDERERERFFYLICVRIYSSQIFDFLLFTLVILMVIDGELHLGFPLGIEKKKIRSLFS